MFGSNLSLWSKGIIVVNDVSRVLFFWALLIISYYKPYYKPYHEMEYLSPLVHVGCVSFVLSLTFPAMIRIIGFYWILCSPY
jgi:hypothetical protein